MERTKTNNKKPIPINVLSEVVNRSLLMSRLGYQYGGDRDIYEALGYKDDLTYTDYVTQYKRQDIAKAIINRPISKTWKGEFGIVESTDDNETVLEKAWIELDERLKLKSKFVRLDKLVSFGEYGVLLFGFDDVKEKSDFAKPVSGGKRQLLYLKPIGEGNADIIEYVKDPNNPRYDMPEFYNLKFTRSDNTSETIRTHWTRLLHVANNLLEDEIAGEPVLQSVFNRLKDLEKLIGGSAEMFWRGARPGYFGKLDPEYQKTDQTEEGLKDQLDEYEHNLRRILLADGYDLTALQTQVSNPKDHVDVQIQMISAVTEIPKRILTGSERGELSSSQDEDNWLDYIQTRREEYAEPLIVRAFVDKCIQYGILPKAGAEGYSVQWEDLYSKSEKDKADLGKTLTEAIKSYISTPGADMMISPEAFLRHILGIDEETVNLIMEMTEQYIRENPEPEPTPEERQIIDEEQEENV